MIWTCGMAMGTCELCGIEKVTTRTTRASSTIVDCCTRCIVSLGLTPVQQFTDKFSTQKVGNSTIPNVNQLVGSEKEELISNFHVKIREERELRKWSQQDLAKKTNEKLNLIQKIENGNRVTDSVLRKISKILDIKIYDSMITHNERQVKTKIEKEMTMEDANITPETDHPKKKNVKKKMRRLGVTRNGGRKKPRE